MPLGDFGQLSLEQNIALFLAAAAVIWLAGSRLAIYADIIADRTGMGEAFTGLVLLAVATSLPEVGRTIAASVAGDAVLAVNSLFGGVTLQTTILAVADLTVTGRALTYFAPRPVLLLQGAAVVLLLSLAITGIAAGEILRLPGAGLWTTMLVAVYLLSLYTLRQYEGRAQWRPVQVPPQLEMERRPDSSGRRRGEGVSMARVALLFAISSGTIFLAGVILAEVGAALAVQSGLGAGFVGATLLAFASSLPELSTTISAVRLGAYSMAVSNIFGTNAFLVALLFLSDLFYPTGYVLEAVGRSALFAAAAGIVTTSIYLVGLIERRNRVVLGMGIDSLVVLLAYLGTLGVLYYLR
ncbi:MAG: sodium:calcium antiporter [Sphingomonadaceae bacterium]